MADEQNELEAQMKRNRPLSERERIREEIRSHFDVREMAEEVRIDRFVRRLTMAEAKELMRWHQGFDIEASAAAGRLSVKRVHRMRNRILQKWTRFHEEESGR